MQNLTKILALSAAGDLSPREQEMLDLIKELSKQSLIINTEKLDSAVNAWNSGLWNTALLLGQLNGLGQVKMLREYIKGSLCKVNEVIAEKEAEELQLILAAARAKEPQPENPFWGKVNPKPSEAPPRPRAVTPSGNLNLSLLEDLA